MSYRFEDSFRAGPVVSCHSKFGKLVHLLGFIIKKFVTMHGHKKVKLLGALSSGRWDGMGGPCDTLVVEEIYKYRNLAWKTEGRRPLWQPRLIWKDNIEVDLKDRGWKGEDWIERARE